MTTAELAAQHNLDAGAVESMVAFLRDLIAEDVWRTARGAKA